MTINPNIKSNNTFMGLIRRFADIHNKIGFINGNQSEEQENEELKMLVKSSHETLEEIVEHLLTLK